MKRCAQSLGECSNSCQSHFLRCNFGDYPQMKHARKCARAHLPIYSTTMDPSTQIPLSQQASEWADLSGCAGYRYDMGSASGTLKSSCFLKAIQIYAISIQLNRLFGLSPAHDTRTTERCGKARGWPSAEMREGPAVCYP